MSEQPQHPDRVGQALNFIMEMAKLAPIDKVAERLTSPGPMPTTHYQAFEKLQHELHVMAVYWNTGELPPGVTMTNAPDNGKPSTTVPSPPDRGVRQQRQGKQRAADKEAPAPDPAPE